MAGWALLGGGAGCVAAERPVGGWELDQPRVSAGRVFAANTDAEVGQLERALEEGGKGSEARPGRGAEALVKAAIAGGVEPQGAGDGGPVAGRLIPMPRLNPTEQRELLAGLRLRLGVERGYQARSTGSEPGLPRVPEGVEGVQELVWRGEGRVRVLRFGIHPFVSRASELWCEALERRGDGRWDADPALGEVDALVREQMDAASKPKPDLTRDDLAYRIIQVSYIDTTGALEALKGFGIETADNPSLVKMPVPFRQLPLVARMPSPEAQKTGLLGADTQKVAGAFDLSVTPSMATTLPPDPNLARASQLLVYYHPANPEQFTRVQQLLDQYIDRPAAQIFIEGLVLEISEAGLKDLGVEWQYKEGGAEFSIGNLFPGLPAVSSGAMTFDNLRDLEQQWIVRLRALIQEEKAEVLSRPSVLTLNNRQATIRVGQEIPIATSSEAGVIKDANRVSFNFKYLPTGISLNIRPRLNEDGSEVSMLVDTVVSSAIPGADLELRSASGEVLASAPTVATRRVQTYTRIGNNTPFIIGGLVNRQVTSVRRKVPLLGDIPYLGALFRSRSTRSEKQEVIIVLTPHVLPEAISERAWGRYLPRDDDKFDDVGNSLFRASYRIREEDVLDLSFLDRNERLQRYRRVAQRMAQVNDEWASAPPFSLFAGGRTPGEHVLVERMIYELLKRLSDKNANWLDRRVSRDRLIFFSGRNAGGYDVQFLEQALARFGDGADWRSFFERNPGKALALTYRQAPSGGAVDELTPEPIPEIALVACPDRKSWSDQLWALNQPGSDGAPRAAILIQSLEDLVRLQRVVLLREVIGLNGGPARVTRKNFGLGQVVLVPDENPLETRLLDFRAAELFLHTEHYYATTLRMIETATAQFDRFLEQPEFRQFK